MPSVNIEMAEALTNITDKPHHIWHAKPENY